MPLEIYGIETNNLKSVNISVGMGKVAGVFGISGGGKSSLCYETIYLLCSQEMKSIETGYAGAEGYVVRGFEGLVPALAIRQKNTNSNPRSSLYTYLNISSSLRAYSSKYEEEKDVSTLFGIGKLENTCKECNGLGESYQPNLDLIVDDSKKISEMPFFPWKSGVSDKKVKLLEEFCLSEGVECETRFSSLKESNKDKLLYGESSLEYKISFKHNGRKRSRSLKYNGVVKELLECLGSEKVSLRNYAKKYCSSTSCLSCNGSRVDVEKYRKLKVFGVPFVEFVCSDISRIHKIIDCRRKEGEWVPRHFYDLVSSINEVGLGYLNLSRSVPSLSGGELQKLNFAKLISSKITNILIVLDEISSQLHVSDYDLILRRIRGLSDRGNAVVLVEHNKYFLSCCDDLWEVGPEPGLKGGYLKPIKNERKTWQQICDQHLSVFGNYMAGEASSHRLYKIDSVASSNGIVHDLLIPYNSVTSIVGKSGSGKTTFARNMSQKYDFVYMVGQEALRGNVRSTVATFLMLGDAVAGFFSKKLSVSQDMFTSSSGKIGACSTCDGAGCLKYEIAFGESEYVNCPSCKGGMFSLATYDYNISKWSVGELYSTPFCDIDFEVINIPRLNKASAVMNGLGLGHLSMGRKISSLSGGEGSRIKLAKFLLKRPSEKILVIDEPGAGLDDHTSHKVMSFIASYKEKFNAIIVIDHKPSVFLCSDYLVEFGPGAGRDGGNAVFSGTPLQYYKEKYCNKK